MTLIVIRFVIKLREYFFKVVLKITALGKANTGLLEKCRQFVK